MARSISTSVRPRSYMVLRFHITALWQTGGNLGAYIGSTANPSSLVSADTTRLDSVVVPAGAREQ